jgi:hypothetical protein
MEVRGEREVLVVDVEDKRAGSVEPLATLPTRASTWISFT